MNKLVLAVVAVGVVQFGELKDGTFSDITLYGGFNKYIKR